MTVVSDPSPGPIGKDRPVLPGETAMGQIERHMEPTQNRSKQLVLDGFFMFLFLQPQEGKGSAPFFVWLFVLLLCLDVTKMSTGFR